MLMQIATKPIQPPAEPLSSKGMINLKRQVWMMPNGMKVDPSWHTGIWYCLRSATGRPSPQSFSVDVLPALGEECRRIMKITSAVHRAIYYFEKEVLSKVIRKRGQIEPLLNEIRLKLLELLELQEQESKGLLMLDRFEQNSAHNLVCRR